ncbi:MAG: FAD:protein FMN transferase [Candidatus Omnitrophica bacterium]|nr:FAD:protein FMN transferase [Candidatus Omnitrophota bacterium]
MKRWIVYLSVVLMIAGCARQETEMAKYSEMRTMMGTFVRIDVCETKPDIATREAAYAAVWKRLEEIAWRMNVFDERSDVTKVNEAYEQPAQIGTDTYDVIQSAIKYNSISNGAFDITVWPLIHLWKENAKAGRLPEESEVITVMEALGPDNLLMMPPDRVQLRHPETKIDLGGIAKGYAVDEAARILREHGIERFYIDAGGDLYVGGLNCAGESWKIAIRNPYSEKTPLTIVSVSNQAVTTSGNYEQYLKVENKSLSHIIDPRTGHPQEHVVSATMIAPTAEAADALSTALSVLGEEEGLVLVDTLGEDYAGLILSLQENGNPREFRSKEFKKFELKQ